PARNLKEMGADLSDRPASRIGPLQRMGPRSYRSPLETKKAAPAPGWYLIPLGPVPCLPHTGTSTACIDCRTETQPNKAAGNYEQFIVTDQVWQAAGMPLGNSIRRASFSKAAGAACALGASSAGSGAGSRTPISSGRRGYGRT